jgi:hypothetical protein
MLMGWGSWLLLGDFGQQLDIEDMRSETSQFRRYLLATRSDARASGQQIKQLQKEVDELKLYLGAAFRLLATKGIATPDEIKALVGAVEQGQPDKGKTAAPPPVPRRPLPRRNRRPS